MASLVAVGASGRSVLAEVLVLIKRTYQPSKLRRNRKVGFLGRLATKVRGVRGCHGHRLFSRVSWAERA